MTVDAQLRLSKWSVPLPSIHRRLSLSVRKRHRLQAVQLGRCRPGPYWAAPRGRRRHASPSSGENRPPSRRLRPDGATTPLSSTRAGREPQVRVDPGAAPNRRHLVTAAPRPFSRRVECWEGPPAARWVRPPCSGARQHHQQRDQHNHENENDGGNLPPGGTRPHAPQ